MELALFGEHFHLLLDRRERLRYFLTMLRNFLIFSLLSLFSLRAEMLIPMDEVQTDHLRAYGVAYRALQLGIDVEWLLNYRGGSFMMPEDPEVEKFAQIQGVYYVLISPSEVASIYATIEENNMNHILLEKAPKVAVYIPPYAEPWDDAVALALEYANIPYDRIYDEDILSGKLRFYDWLHLHHEDFTGQYGKFYLAYHNADWYQREVKVNEEIARKLGYDKVWKLKHAVAREIRRYVEGGGFLFAMCSAPITLDIALASERVDIVGVVYDGDPPEADAEAKLDFSKTFAFTNFNLVMDPLVYEHSNVDVTREASLRGPDTYFTLFNFSAKYDPCLLYTSPSPRD